MKKLNLKFKGIGEMLNKEQMKKITGGDYNCGFTECVCPQNGADIGCTASPADCDYQCYFLFGDW
jgi:hypothetical protein